MCAEEVANKSRTEEQHEATRTPEALAKALAEPEADEYAKEAKGEAFIAAGDARGQRPVGELSKYACPGGRQARLRFTDRVAVFFHGRERMRVRRRR